jgi:O-antigen/teichoic acid export membrane protein
VEFGKHIGKGLWAFADKALPVVYGLGLVFLVIRVLPEKEYGAFLVVQAIFLFVSALGYAFALQPLTKYAAETDDNGPYLVSSLTMIALFYALVSLVVLTFKGMLITLLDPAGRSNLTVLLNYLPLLLLTAMYRSFAISLLQASYQVKEIFWIDAVYFLGTPMLIYVAQMIDRFSTAEDLVVVSAISQAGSTILAFFLTRKPMSVKLSARREAYSKMWHFGKFSLLSSVGSALFSQLDILFLSSFAGVVQVAIYGAAKVFSRIFDVFNQVIQVFVLPATSRFDSRGDVASMQVLIEKTIWFSTLALVPVWLLFVFGADFMVSFFYKDRYIEASHPLRILGFLALTTPWSGVLSTVLVGMGKVKQGLYLSWLFILASVLFYFLLIPTLGVVGAALASVMGSFVLSLSVAVYVNRFIPLRVRSIIGRTRDVTNFVHRRFADRNV